MDNVVSLLPCCEAIIINQEKKYRAAREMQVIPKRIDMYSTKKRKHRLLSHGDHLLAKIRSALQFFDSTNDYERSAHQRKFHESMIAACVRHIYADEFSSNFLQILEENNWPVMKASIAYMHYHPMSALTLYCV